MTSFPFLVPNLKPASSDHMERARQRRMAQIEAGLRKRLRAKHRRRPSPETTETQETETSADAPGAVATEASGRYLPTRLSTRLMLRTLAHPRLATGISASLRP